ncbi:probable apyrase 6 isoform X1 [Manihot esculenta]|uniref:Uncharacterized protein n=1 Tax=Manihot esculenta TaxID=3983 RepID=A0ACB7GWZ3_MANES|nr:probable apyrase 6 isoform X1 [Manihot esculenta]KAG8644138.1 hypothetical protein MANES_11G103201v8 [Manihot esculenta]
MDFSTLQSRASTAYFPPHRTQLHPRMHLNSFSSPYQPSQNPNNKSQIHKFLILFIFLLTVPFLFYLFSTAQKIHHSSKFAEPKSKFFSVLIDSGLYGSRVRVYELLAEGTMPFTDGSMPLIAGSMKVRSGLAGFAENPENAGDLVDRLVKFAKGRVPKKEWGNTKVQLMAGGEKVDRLELKVREMILESCRRVLRESGFAFKEEWARFIADRERGVFAWVAVNYALGTLVGDPQRTTGVVELGGTSLQATFASREVVQGQSLQMIKLAGITYNLQTQSFPNFGQDAAWESLHELHHSGELISLPNDREGPVGNPCIPKGYDLASNASDGKFLSPHPAGNFTACRLEVLALLKNKGKCLQSPCEIVPSLFSELQGKHISQETLFYTSEFFGLAPRTTLFELETVGQQYCEGDWDKLRSQHHGIDEMDLLRYCFSSAYMLALLHDSLGIPMNDKRIGFANYTGSFHLDWSLGAFILQSMLEPLDMETDNLDQIVGNESVKYFSLFAFLLIVVLGVLFVLQWRKPQLKTVYDLEKGHYIVTRVPW